MDEMMDKPWRKNAYDPVPDDYNEVLANGKWFKQIGRYMIMRRLHPVLRTWAYTMFMDGKSTRNSFDSLEEVCTAYPEVTMADVEAAMWLSQKELP